MHVVFENTGEIDLRTITTFGCSVKEGNNPIGFFGTGLKYAIAVLLRFGHSITVQSGETQFEVTAKSDLIRGKSFEFIQLGDTPTGFTTELGKNWEVWMAYRELFCNAKDEKDSETYESESLPPAVAGKTRVIVTGHPIRSAHQKKEEFLLEGKPAFRIGSIEVFTRPSESFFYRGIKVMKLNQPALYTYNETDQVELTEDRTAKDPGAVYYKLAREILGHAERPMLEKVLMASNQNMEFFLDFHGWTMITPARDFFPTVAALQRSAVTRVNGSAIRLWREKGQGFIDPRRIKPTAIQVATLEKAIAFCEKAGFMLKGEYPIIIVETLGENGSLALADVEGKQIFLTERIFNEGGTKGVAGALIEEYLHLKFGFVDCSRQMQNFIFAKMISLAEELQGEPL